MSLIVRLNVDNAGEVQTTFLDDDTGVDAGLGGYQVVDVGGAKAGGTATGLANDATVYTATVSVNGGTAEDIDITGSAAQTYTALISALDTDTTGATWAINSGNLRCTSALIGVTSTISIVDTDLFSTLTDFVAIDTAIFGIDTQKKSGVAFTAAGNLYTCDWVDGGNYTYAWHNGLRIRSDGAVCTDTGAADATLGGIGVNSDGEMMVEEAAGVVFFNGISALADSSLSVSDEA